MDLGNDTSLAGSAASPAKGEHASSKQAFRMLKAGEVMPSGWMLEQIRLDLEEGYYPHYDKINETVCRGLFVKQDRLSQKMYDGLRCWWSGEHEGYWKDGMTRMAFLAGNEEQKARVIRWLDEIVAAQGDDGYIGIYRAGEGPNTRFNHEGENGELWSTSRILQALIAAWDFTGLEKYLMAVKRAVDCVIDRDPGNYFEAEGADGGVAHGIGFFDALWFMVDRTGEAKYAEYAKKLYHDFCSVAVRDDDLQIGNLLSDAAFRKHGAHVAEGFYVPQFIASLSNDPELTKAADRAMETLKVHLTPSGAMVCAENVKGQPGSGAAGYEYCGIAELIQAFPKLIALSGRADVADVAETMMFNAAQGSRFSTLTGLIYVNHDNLLKAYPDGENDRTTYSAYHNAAACCTLNGGRVMPYYVEGMWMRSADGLAAALYGPCTVNTVVNGVVVSIEEKTGYPFEDRIHFTVSPREATAFALRLRHPAYAKRVWFEGVEAEREGDFWRIDREWNADDAFAMHFEYEILDRTEVAPEREHYLQRGPLVYALPFPHESDIQKTFVPATPFVLNYIQATDRAGWAYFFPGKPAFVSESLEGDPVHPYAEPTRALKGTLIDPEGRPVEVTLLPIGATVMRRTTFPLSTTNGMA